MYFYVSTATLEFSLSLRAENSGLKFLSKVFLKIYICFFLFLSKHCALCFVSKEKGFLHMQIEYKGFSNNTSFLMRVI